MSPLPLLISVPHGGLSEPVELAGRHLLSADEIRHDGDEGAAEIYSPLKDVARQFITTDIARAFVDLNRPEDDFGRDGIVKTHTCWDVPIYREPPDPDLIETLLARYHRPYHSRLRELASSGVRLGLDCHTMAAEGPPVGPDPGASRPTVCLGNVHHQSCPREWVDALARCFEHEFECEIAINSPFAGGWITRSHSLEMPWVQIELSRAPTLSNAQKGARVLRALEGFCRGEPLG